MAGEAFIFQKLLEVVWHSHQINFDDSVLEMNSRGMDISEYHALVVNVANTIAELSENRNSLV